MCSFCSTAVISSCACQELFQSVQVIMLDCNKTCVPAICRLVHVGVAYLEAVPHSILYGNIDQGCVDANHTRRMADPGSAHAKSDAR